MPITTKSNSSNKTLVTTGDLSNYPTKTETNTLANDAINNRVVRESYHTGNVNYITSVWAPGTGGFSQRVPVKGWYFVKATFSNYPEGDNGMTYASCSIKLNQGANYIATNSQATDSTVMRFVMEPCTIIALNKDDILTPYVHTVEGGKTVETKLYAVLLKTL